MLCLPVVQSWLGPEISCLVLQRTDWWPEEKPYKPKRNVLSYVLNNMVFSSFYKVFPLFLHLFFINELISIHMTQLKMKEKAWLAASQ